MATQSTWQIKVIKGTNSSVYSWQITNLITGNEHCYPVTNSTLNLEISTTTDYSFVWNKDQINQLSCNIQDVKYFGTSTTPNYGSASADYSTLIGLS